MIQGAYFILVLYFFAQKVINMIKTAGLWIAMSGIWAVCTVAAPREPKSDTSSPRSLAAQWRVVDSSAIRADWARHRIVLDWRNLAQATADAGCNTLTYAVQADTNAQTVQIAAVASTLMACESGMDIEMALGQALNQQTLHYQWDKADLILCHSNGTTWRLRKQ